MFFSKSSRYFFLMFLCLIPGGILGAQEISGKNIYANQCASCHGERGQGVPGKYESSLSGDLSLEALVDVIEGTMPADDPDRCLDGDADSVAKFVFDTFYSPSVQPEKLNSIELTHLTNSQYKNSVSDLAARFGGKFWVDPGMSERGFKGRYFSSRHFDSTKSIGERIDTKLDFDFGNGSPFAPGTKMDEFGIQWYAALRIEETGRYEFFVDSPNGVRLFVNDDRTPGHRRMGFNRGGFS